MVYLPNAIIAQVAQQVIDRERCSLFTLLSMAGVCKEWRAIVAALPTHHHVVLDSLTDAQPLSQRAACFRRAPEELQRYFLMRAADLLHGYGSLTVSGPCVVDGTVIKAARRSGHSWNSLRVDGTPAVTDRSLLAVAAKAPGLKQLALVGLPRVSVRGLTALASCTALHSLELSDLAAFDGEEEGGLLDGQRTQLSVPEILLVARLFQSLGNLKELKLAAPAPVAFAAVRFCPQLEQLTYTANSPNELHAVVMALPALRRLTRLSVIARSFSIAPETARLIGALPLTSLRLDSAVYEGQSSAHRMALSHMCNDAVKALVDGVCARWHQFDEFGGRNKRAELREFNLSLRGATGLAHDAVSTLLRLPVLTELDVSGCNRISAMDKMRLVAKVKAGCEVLAAQARRAGRPVAPPGGVALPMEHRAVFRTERQGFAAGNAASGQDSGGSLSTYSNAAGPQPMAM